MQRLSGCWLVSASVTRIPGWPGRCSRHHLVCPFLSTGGLGGARQRRSRWPTCSISGRAQPSATSGLWCQSSSQRPRLICRRCQSTAGKCSRCTCRKSGRLAELVFGPHGEPVDPRYRLAHATEQDCVSDRFQRRTLGMPGRGTAAGIARRWRRSRADLAMSASMPATRGSVSSTDSGCFDSAGAAAAFSFILSLCLVRMLVLHSRRRVTIASPVRRSPPK